VNEPGRDAAPVSRYDLTPRPAIASLAAAAVTTVAGCVTLLIWGRGTGGVVLLVLGIGLLLFGVTLFGTVLLFTARLRALVELDAATITIHRGSRSRVLRWTDIDQVSINGPRLRLQAKHGKRDAVVINPRTPADPVFMSLVAAISQRLDASRGYRQLG
jgi:hypothetical protein